MTPLRLIVLSGVGAWFFSGLSEAANAPYRAAVLSDGATAYYELDEVRGTASASDSAGGDNGGILVGNPAYGSPSLPELKDGILFSTLNGGLPDAIRIPDSPTFDLGTGPFSLEMWFLNNNTDTGILRGDLFTYKGPEGEFSVRLNSQPPPPGFDASVSLYFNGFVSNSGVGSAIGPFHHVAVTRGPASLLSIYLDGVLGASGINGSTLNISNDLLIGANHDGDPSHLAFSVTAVLDEVAWYPLALTQAQINNHLLLAGQVPEPSVAALALGAWPFLNMRRFRAIARAGCAP